MYSVQSPRPLRGCREAAETGRDRELRRDNKVRTRTRARRREEESLRKEIEAQERLDAEEAEYRRVWNEGNELFYKKKHQEAAAHYSEAIKKNPNEPAVLSNRAKCHIFLGALPEGLVDAEKCIELDPTFLIGYVCKAKVQALMHNYECSLATYIEGLKCDPNNLVVTDGLRRCLACIKRSSGGDVGPDDLKDILRDWHSDIDLCNELKKYMEEVAVFKKEASDERLRRIESERMARTLEEQQVQRQKETDEDRSKTHQELQQLKVRQDEVTDELQKANQHNEHIQHELIESKNSYIEELQKVKVHSENVQHQLLEFKERCNQLQSEHDQLLNERDCAVGEVEKLHQRRGEILSVLRTAMPRRFSSSELEWATGNLNTSLKIGGGEFASVYQGVLWNMKVAIKVLRPDVLQGRSQFEEEIAIHSRVRHPNMVTLLGACPESYALVYEFLSNGNLEDFLLCADKRQTLTWHIRVRIIAEICSALIFLHENKPDPVIHGDLKPANILLDANLVSKLSDFGIPHLLNQSNSNSTKHPVETSVYMDPEFLATWKMTTRSDVYSFGIVVLRLLTGRSPVGIIKIVKDAMDQGDLNSIVDTSAGEWPYVQIHQLAELALSCTELSRTCRPDLSGQLWTAVEAMRDVAASSSLSSPSSVRDENNIPSYFICPISQDIMNDPHVAADGFTYEGDSIRSWLGRGKKTSPMTNLQLHNRELIPNLALRSAIQDWLQQHNTLLQ
ncbi:U-box domain-containing protein 70-like [Lolium rigidum]|uniref:U-box domain-containing protein 70-like n=1 Tax=Lolium rigidum TaxID=89674 RepID=UPI001F5E05D4|nr:U-box domain-containing protein 70-like [Lolium rigidum]